MSGQPYVSVQISGQKRRVWFAGRELRWVRCTETTPFDVWWSQ